MPTLYLDTETFNEERGMVRNEANIPAEWIKPACWPENKTLGYISTKNGNILFHVLNDYSYGVMLRELAFRVDFLCAKIDDLEAAVRASTVVRPPQ